MTFEELERIRLEYYQKLKNFYVIAAAIIGGLVVLSIFLSFFFLIVSFVFIVPFILFFIYFITRKDAARWHDAYKAYFVDRNLRNVFSDVYYNHSVGLNRNVILSTGMMRTGDVYISNDYVSGKYKDVSFYQADVTLQDEHTDNEGHTSYTTFFRGRWMVFEFPKKFAFKMQIVQRNFHGEMRTRNDQGKRINRIETESIEFNRTFNVYAEDGFEMFYILTPDLIAKIEDMVTGKKCRLMLCFIDNKLHVALNDNKDAFEVPSARKPINEEEENKKISADIKTITDFVEYLKLDRKLFKN